MRYTDHVAAFLILRMLSSTKLKFFKILPLWLLCVFLVSCAPEVHQDDQEALYVYQDEQTKLYGFKNARGDAVIPAQYDHVHIGDHYIDDRPLFVKAKFNPENEYCLPTMLPVTNNGQIWWIDRTGKKLFESFCFDNGPDYFQKGLSRILKDKKFGFLDTQGKVAIEPQYDFVSPFDEDGFANACNGCWLSYPTNTKFSVAHKRATDVHGKIEGGKWGIISTTGDVIVPLKYDSCKKACEQLLKSFKSLKVNDPPIGIER